VKVIRVFLRGGLGNQFFQWLYAQHLASQGWDVRLNSMLLRKISRNQARGTFELQRVFEDIGLRVEEWKGIGSLESVISRVGKVFGLVDGDVTTARLRLAPLQYGYYQTPIFASDELLAKVRSNLKQEFLVSPVKGRYSVLHVRAGDYAASRYNFQEIGRLAYGYYVEAFGVLVRENPDSAVIIVSDDQTAAVMVKKRLISMGSGRNVHILSELLQHRESADDALRTMLGADILATANSSFSAMAGYLRGGVTVAPNPWFRGNALHQIDPCMGSWRRVAAVFDDTIGQE